MTLPAKVKTADRLNQRGIKPSVQRLAIYENLLGRLDHPTADCVWEDLIERIPTLSRTTVYTTLNLLCDKGLVLVVLGDCDKIHFDAITTQHAHFICAGCKCILNVGETSLVAEDFQIPKGTKIMGIKVCISGYCVQCLKEYDR